MFVLRRAAREGRRTGSRSGELETGAGVGHQASRETREGRIAVRPLLENSTACRKSVPSNNPVPGSSELGGDSFG